MDIHLTTGALTKALAAFQGEITNPPKTKTAKVPTKTGSSYQYKYADLPDIIDVTKTPLAKHGLSVSMTPVSTAEGIGVEPILMHSSGEYIKGDPFILPFAMVNATPQGAGSAITYARRYALASILGISADEDDDAELATHHTATAPAPNQISPKSAPQETRQPAPPAQSATGELATEPQTKRLFVLLRNAQINPDEAKGYMATKYGVDSSKKLTKRQISEFMGHVEDGTVLQAINTAAFNAVEVPDEQGGEQA